MKRILTTMIGTAMFVGSMFAAPAMAETKILLYRVFGGCSDEYANVTDLSKAVGECGIIQVLANKFNAENGQGIVVETQNVEWGKYYDLLSATYAAGDPPDIAVMHRSVLPNFVARDLLKPLSHDFATSGIDAADFAPVATAAIAVGNELYGLPFDIHALLFHLNADLMKQAGLVNDAGKPIMPTSPEEMLAHARIFKERTGKNYIAIESNNISMPIRLFNSWMWQQGVDVTAPDASAAGIDTPEGREALDLLLALYNEGHIDSNLDYSGAEQAFLNGEAGILINGTWVVDHYTAQAESGQVDLKNYMVSNIANIFGTPAVWSDSHMWVLPKKDDAAKHAAALAFLKFLNDNNYEWARTGHLPVRSSVISGEALAKLPHRTEYAGTAKIARALPAIQNQRAIQDAMITNINATWLNGTSPADALSSAQAAVERILRRSRR